MSDSVGGATGAQSQPNIFQKIGQAIVKGAQAIGNKIVEFGHKIADFFNSLGNGAQNAGNNAHPAGASHPVLAGKTFTAEQKQQYKQDAQQSQFYTSLAGSTDTYINQGTFDSIMDAVLDTPRTAAAMEAYGVTLEEAIAISMYTSQAYRQVNDSLRNNDGNPAMQGLANAFTSALAKLPSFDGNPVDTPTGTYYQAFRGAKLPQNVGTQHTVNAMISDPGIMSSSYDEGEAFGGVNYSMTLLLKAGSQGKDITAFSDKPTEAEVAFPPNVQFQVTARVFDSGGLLPPHMEANYHPGFDMTGMAMGTVQLVMQEV
ncbi:MAG: ADP-ribosyltransferase [Pseudomonadota bacterium]